ncbi:MAG: hypothetical protein J3R72DRAFT_45375 [Linnemannia gamsii]|nr:MAG: hypothetical protein J3R72DRAFT_45375 [Linnemannia gamsii]
MFGRSDKRISLNPLDNRQYEADTTPIITDFQPPQTPTTPTTPRTPRHPPQSSNYQGYPNNGGHSGGRTMKSAPIHLPSGGGGGGGSSVHSGNSAYGNSRSHQQQHLHRDTQEDGYGDGALLSQHTWNGPRWRPLHPATRHRPARISLSAQQRVIRSWPCMSRVSTTRTGTGNSRSRSRRWKDGDDSKKRRPAKASVAAVSRTWPSFALAFASAVCLVLLPLRGSCCLLFTQCPSIFHPSTHSLSLSLSFFPFVYSSPSHLVLLIKIICTVYLTVKEIKARSKRKQCAG